MVILGHNIGNAQCATGTEPECQCSTAQVLCTVDSLDGFQFSMDPFLHPQDAPNPLCPGPFCSCAPHNPTWFAFVAWCTDLDLEVQFDNCVAGNGSIGAQIAIYGDCDNFTPIDCNVSAADCNTNDKTLNLTNLEIGQVYYFLIDGCSGSYCDVTIDVIGTCGAEEIEPWTNPVSGEENVCVGETTNYSVDNLDGANLYHWYLDGVEIGTSEDPNFDISWPTEGTFELCVDASNDPCVPVTDPPAQICMTINVFDPDAGTIEALPNPLCPGETTDITVTGYNMNPGLELSIIIVDGSNQVSQVTIGDFTDFSSDLCESYTAYAYQYIIADNPVLPTVGSNFSAPDCGTDCCDLVSTTISFEDTENPVILNAPGDTTIECFDLLPVADDLNFTDNCMPSGMVSPTDNGTADLCSGGTIERRWTVVDSCGNRTDHTQNITIDPIPEAAFLNIPPDSSIFCNQLPSSYPDLEYSNGASDLSCEISGFAPPVVIENIQDCAGTIEVLWEFTDVCGRLLSHTQTITVVPPAQASFINPPVNETISCPDFSSFTPVDLSFDNGESGACAINGVVSPTISGSADECGGTITYTWEYIDICNRTISHQQIITVEPAVEASFNSLPSDVTLNCADLPLPTPPDLTYSNGSSGDCLIEGVISPNISGSADECGGTVVYTWEFTDDCGRTITHIQNITVEPADAATFTNPPADITLSCNDFPLPTPPDLDYTNGASGICLIDGAVSPQQNGSADECGGSFTYTWEFTDDCGRTISHVQNVTIDPIPQANFVNPPAATTLSCGDFEALGIPDLAYDNGETGSCAINGSVPGTQNGSVGPCGGTVTIDWTFQDNCGRIINHSQTINVEPASVPEFINVPQDITVSCAQATGVLPGTVQFTNNGSGNCLLSGAVAGTNAPSFNACGGVITQVWVATDACGNNITTQRVITVEPAPAPQWVNPPGDITINCEEVELLDEELTFSNNAGAGSCLIEETVTSIFSGSYDACGGSLVQEWSAVDDCGNVLTHSRNITVNAAGPPDFINPPADVTLGCGEDFPDDYEILYTNNSNAPCEISGSVLSTRVINGLTATYTWEWVNPCDGSTLNHQQLITLTEEPDIIADPSSILVCEGGDYDLSQIQITDQNGGQVSISFHDALPPSPSNEVGPVYAPPSAGTIYIRAININGCEDIEPLIIELETPPSAGDNQTVEICENDINIDLNSFLSGNFETDGFWTSEHGNLIDISDPSNVSFLNIPPGVYTFNYIVAGDIACPPDTAIINVDVLALPTINILSISCAAGNDFYEVILELSPGSILQPDIGEVENLGNNQFRIFNIPVTSNLTIFALLNTGICPTIIPVNAPDCDCPNVPAPVAGPDALICEGDAIPGLSVTVETGLFANWFDTPSGGNPIQTNSTNYTPTISGPGVYTFYVESYNLPDSCLSATRTPVTLEVRALPQGNEIELQECSDSGFANFNLNEAVGLITNNPNITISFHLSVGDAMDSLNALSTSFTNTQPNSQTLYVRLTGSSGCVNVLPFQLRVNPNPSFETVNNSETCAQDSSGSIELTNLIGSAPFNYLLNGVSQNDSLFTNLSSGSYRVEVVDSNNCFFSDTVILDAGLELSLEIVGINCDNNATVTDSTDDTYILEIVLTHSSNNGTFRIDGPGVSLSGQNYGVPISITLAADGNVQTLTFTDEATNCSISYTTQELVHCSTDCSLVIDSWEAVCDDNNTPTDPTDDTYLIWIVANGTNTGNTNQYIARIAGQNSIQMYGDTAIFSLPANGLTETLTVTDQEITACFASLDIGPLDPCSNECEISTEIISVNCDNNNTEDDNSDDLYTIRLVITGQNTGGNGYEINGTSNWNYGDTITLGPFPISGGDQSFSIIDLDRTDCTLEVTVPAPPPCSDPCELSTNFNVLECNNNGTGANTNDDFVSIELNVTVLEGSPTRFVVLDQDGNILFGPLDYGIPHILSPVPANGTQQILIIRDELSPQCVDTLSITEDGCSECTETFVKGPDAVLSCNSTSEWIYVEANNALQILWSGPSGFNERGDSIQVSRAGTYIVDIEFADSCWVRDSILVSSDTNLPVASVGPNGILNCETDSFLVQNTSNLTNPNLIAQWTDENGNVLPSSEDFWTDSAGVYDLIVIDTINQCTSSVETVIVRENYNQPQAIILASPDSIFDCFTRSITLTAEQQADARYLWIGNEFQSNERTVTVQTAGQIMLIVIDTLSLCGDSSTILLEDLNDYPFVSIREPDTLNCFQSTIVLDGGASFTGDSILHEWLAENQNIITTDTLELEVNQGGWYYLRSTDIRNGCQTIDSVFVVENFSPPSGSISGDFILGCGEESGSLSLESTQELINIQWSSVGGTIVSGENTETINYNGGGVYTVTFMNPLSLCEDSLSVIVETTEELDYDFSKTDIICAGEFGNFAITQINGTPPYSISWEGRAVNLGENIENITPGEYILEISDSQDCSLRDTIRFAEGQIVDIDLLEFIRLQLGEEALIEAFVQLDSSQIAAINWSPPQGLSCTDCLITRVTAISDTEYTITVQDSSGCIGEASIRLIVEIPEVNIYIPNIMTPNGDNINDYFILYSEQGVTIEEMMIFDRWGNKLFESNNLIPGEESSGWDGTFRGKTVGEGVYVYSFKVRMPDGGIRYYKGDVTISR
jgi:gliding motility-associated-like protein